MTDETVDRELEAGRRILAKHWPNLARDIVQAMMDAEHSGQRVEEAVTKALLWEICHECLHRGMFPTKLCGFAITVLEIANKATTQMQKDIDEQNRREQNASAEVELADEEKT